ncbi:uncharacterized protein OCT59_027027 [Rhizophagus irregularis]|nr:hypothetical protein OCT59_027027 [Rhizophagus irregularis]
MNISLLYEQEEFNQKFGLCPECNQPNTHVNWCKEYWNRDTYEINYEVNDPKIKNPLKSNENYAYPIVLKSLNDSSNVKEDFLNEWKLHLKCQHKARAYGSFIISLYGITQDPDTLNYMIVMHVALGNLRDDLLTIKYNPNDKFRILYNITVQLKAIHKLNLIHGDFHSGNILNIYYGTSVISDLGLCKPVNQSNTNDEIFGVLPYIAPEVLRGKPYTKAADVYSLDICKGFRPEIIEGTLPEYVELMKRCWDNDPKKRPTAKELFMIFDEWDDEYPKENDDKKRIPVPDYEPEIVYHPKSCYTSRKINYSTKLNECLIHDNEFISENLDEYMIKDLKHK